MDIRKYIFGNTQIEYLIDENGRVSLRIIPKTEADKCKKQWEAPKTEFNPGARYIHNWSNGNIAYYHLVGQNQDSPGYTMKCGHDLKYIDQTLLEKDNETSVITIIGNEIGYKISHTLRYINGLRGFEIETEFINESEDDVCLDMLSSFALDNLSPFHDDDAHNSYKFHRFFGGWSLEGKHICQTIEELSLEKPWIGFNGNNEKFGSMGSYPVKRYFPTAAFEDSENGVLWAAQLAHNATWQMELSRADDSLSFTGGMGDRDFCGWKKNIKSGESFKAPKAFIATVKGDIYDACTAVVDMQKPAYEAKGEKKLYTSFNEYCATWGRPTQEKMISFCKSVKPYGIKYLVIDAGWCSEGHEQDSNGEWGIDKNIFPDMKEMNRIIRENGMIPGIWFEFEVTTKGSKMFEPEYDFMHLHRDGNVLKSSDWRSYWDFRREDVREYLYEKVIKLLKDNDFGYIKVDYNANIGIAVDGAESGAEGLREHLQCVREFFEKMREEIPGLVIENCASGGHRLEPSMMGVSTVSSFSDAHETVENPYIAANLHNLMLPSQELIWAVLHNDDSDERLKYSLASTFFGRVCLSGRIDTLLPGQLEIVKNAMDFYDKLDCVLKNGTTKIYGNRGKCMHYPEGTQIAVRSTDNEILIICHAFDNPGGEFKIDIPTGFAIKERFYCDNISVENDKLVVGNMQSFTGCAALLEKII